LATRSRGNSGEILNEEFLKPLGLTANALAKAIGVPPNRTTAILKDERGIMGDTAIRLGTFFKTSTEFRLNLQMTYDCVTLRRRSPAGWRCGLRASSVRTRNPARHCHSVIGIPPEDESGLSPAW
jgi:addiction module HigA family antidote